MNKKSLTQITLAIILLLALTVPGWATTYNFIVCPVGTISSVNSSPTNGGNGYTLNDILTITTGGTGGKVQVTGVSGGVVTAVTLIPSSPGSGYTTGTGKATSGGTGSSCTVNITVNSPTAPYNTAATAANDALVVAIWINSNCQENTDTKNVYVTPETYIAVNTFTNVKCSHMNIYGCIANGDNPIPSYSVVDSVIFAPTTNYVMSVGAHDVTVRYVTLKNYSTRNGISLSGNNFSLIQCKIIPATNTAVQPIYVSGPVTGLLIDQCEIQVAPAQVGIQLTANAISGTLQRSKITNAINMTPAQQYIYSQTTGTFNVYTNTMLGGTSVYHNGIGGALISANNLYDGSLFGVGAAILIKGTNGTFTSTNDYVIPSMVSPSTAVTSGTITVTGLIQGGNPSLVTPGPGAYICPMIDDNSDFSIAQAVSTLMGARGLKGTFSIHPNPTDWSSANNAALRTLITDGNMEVGLKSWSNSRADATVLGTITYTGLGLAPHTYAIDLVNHTFTVATSNLIDNYVYTFASDNTTSIGTIIAGIATGLGNSHWVFTPVTNVTQTSAMISSCTGVGVTNITTPINLDLTGASQGFYKNEILDAAAYLASKIVNGTVASPNSAPVTDPQTNATYACNTQVCPGGVYNAAYSAVALAGNVANGNLLAQISIAATQNFSNYNLYSNQRTVDITTGIFGASPDITKANVRAMCFAAAQVGTLIRIQAHTESAATWTPVLDALQEMQNAGVVTVTSYQLAAKALRASPWTYTGATGIATMIYADTRNYRLRPNSLCVGAGSATVSPHGTLDYTGNDLWNGRGAPPIGAYGNPRGAGD